MYCLNKSPSSFASSPTKSKSSLNAGLIVAAKNFPPSAYTSTKPSRGHLKLVVSSFNLDPHLPLLHSRRGGLAARRCHARRHARVNACCDCASAILLLRGFSR